MAGKGGGRNKTCGKQEQSDKGIGVRPRHTDEQQDQEKPQGGSRPSNRPLTIHQFVKRKRNRGGKALAAEADQQAQADSRQAGDEKTRCKALPPAPSPPPRSMANHDGSVR